MKAFLPVILIAVTAFFSCHKSGYSTSTTGDWRLVHKYSYIGLSNRVLTPSRDSSVSLSLNTNNTYTTWLNKKVVSQGSYSISTDTAFYNNQLLELNNFTPTGIFSLFRLVQVGANGQVLSVFDGFYMHLSHDSLALSGALTPGGSISYLFVRQ